MIDLDSMPVRELLPPLANLKTALGDDVPRINSLHDFKRFEGGCRADALCPEGAADEGGLRGFHHLAPSDGGGNGVAVAKRFSKHGHVWLNIIFLVQAAKSFAEAGGALVKDEHNTSLGGKFANLMQEIVLRLVVSDHFHLDDANVMRVNEKF